MDFWTQLLFTLALYFQNQAQTKNLIAEKTYSGGAEVISGDTFDFYPDGERNQIKVRLTPNGIETTQDDFPSKEPLRIRVKTIEAPKLTEPHGKDAKNALTKVLQQGEKWRVLVKDCTQEKDASYACRVEIPAQLEDKTGEDVTLDMIDSTFVRLTEDGNGCAACTEVEAELQDAHKKGIWKK